MPRFQYDTAADLPPVVPVFPLSGALLLPRGVLPLNIFEPRYLDMVDDALRGNRLIGIVQPQAALESDTAPESPQGTPDLCQIGCLGRLTGFQESDDDRYVISLLGICRFRLIEEMDTVAKYRQFRIETEMFESDLDALAGEDGVDREKLLDTFKAYLDANEMDADWPSVEETDTESLVNALSMMSPYGPREKQALLEAEDLKTRADILIAITEMTLQDDGGPTSKNLQ